MNLKKIESEAEREYQKKLENRDLKDYTNHQLMLQDTYLTNKNTIDFKERLKQQQKREKDELLLTERRRDENELQLMKIKQKFDDTAHKNQYYEDLSQQAMLKRAKETKNKQLSKNELSLNKEIIDYSRSAGVNALIPGINNWNTVGSVPLKRGVDRQGQSQTNSISISNNITQTKLDPPKITSARNSKYEKLKELENEYYNMGNGLTPANGNSSSINIQNTNPYIEREKEAVAKSMKMFNEKGHLINKSSRNFSWDRKRNSDILFTAGASMLI